MLLVICFKLSVLSICKYTDNVLVLCVWRVMLTFVSLLQLLSSALMTSYVNSFSEIHNIYSPVRHNIKVKQVFVEYCIWKIIQEWLRYVVIVTHMWNTLLFIDNICVWHIRLWYIWIFFWMSRSYTFSPPKRLHDCVVGLPLLYI
jgi:hypothetical protein